MTLDVNGTSDLRNTLTLFSNGSAPTLSVNGTAFKVSDTGLVGFVKGQTFPGAGTITGVTAGAGLRGGGTKGNVTLSVPNSGITNSMLQNPSLTVNPGGGMTGGGKISLGGATTLGLESCSANHATLLLSLKTTVHFTEADKKVLAKLQSLTGLRQSQLIRAALRTLLRRLEATPKA
jgi:hypothetical protein